MVLSICGIDVGLASPSPSPSAQVMPAARALRFGALKAQQVNWRQGPGKGHPVVWVFCKAAGWPVVIVRAKNHWYWVQDKDGVQGWVQGSVLSFRPVAFVSQDTVLWDKPGMQPHKLSPTDYGRTAARSVISGMVAKVKQGVTGKIIQHHILAGQVWYKLSIPVPPGRVPGLRPHVKGWVPASLCWPGPKEFSRWSG